MEEEENELMCSRYIKKGERRSKERRRDNPNSIAKDRNQTINASGFCPLLLLSFLPFSSHQNAETEKARQGACNWRE